MGGPHRAAVSSNAGGSSSASTAMVAILAAPTLPERSLTMGDTDLLCIRREPLFRELVDKRKHFAWVLSAAMLVDLFRVHPDHRIRAQGAGHADRRRRHDGRHSGRPVRHRLGVRAHRHLRPPGEFRIRPDHPSDHGKGEVMRALSIVLAAAGLLAVAAGCHRMPGRRRDRRRRTSGAQYSCHRDVPHLRGHDARHHQVGGQPNPFGGRLLCRRRRDHRLPERTCDRRRLHVGRFVPGHLRASSSRPASTA